MCAVSATATTHTKVGERACPAAASWLWSVIACALHTVPYSLTFTTGTKSYTHVYCLALYSRRSVYFCCIHDCAACLRIGRARARTYKETDGRFNDVYNETVVLVSVFAVVYVISDCILFKYVYTTKNKGIPIVANATRLRDSESKLTSIPTPLVKLHSLAIFFISMVICQHTICSLSSVYLWPMAVTKCVLLIHN